MCSNFARLPGVELELIYPTRQNLIKDDFIEYFEIKEILKVTKIKSPDFHLPETFEIFAFVIKNLISALILTRAVLKRDVDIIYSRDELSLLFLSYFKKNLFFEAHRYSNARTFLYKRLKKSGVKIVTITNALKAAFIKTGFDPKNILVAPDGVNLSYFDLGLSLEGARERVGLPMDKKIVLYAGQLFPWKGADVIALIAEKMPDCLFVFVGGMAEYIENFKARYALLKNVLILGQKLHRDIPYYLKSADVLILPNKKDGSISEFYTSPLKLFEYMASGRPIIASDVSSTREILNESNSILFESENQSSLVTAIKRVFEDSDLAIRISEQALSDVRKYTWDTRAKNILTFIQKK